MKTSLLIFVTLLARFPGRWARKQWRCLVLLTALAACLEDRALAADAAHRLLVKWKDGPQSPAAKAGNAQIGSTVRRSYHAIGWQLVELPAGVSVSEGIKAYQALGTVAVVEPDRAVRQEPPLPPSETSPTEALALASQPLVPNDPLFSQQWHLSKISATNAWDRPELIHESNPFSSIATNHITEALKTSAIGIQSSTKPMNSSRTDWKTSKRSSKHHQSR